MNIIEGCIKNINASYFNAHIHYNENIYEVDFPINDVPKNERHLLAEGVIFYCTIDRLQKAKFTHVRNTPSWKNFDINSSSRKVDEFYLALGCGR